MSKNRPNAAIFAALPPPVGGVSSMVAMLHDLLIGRSDLLFAAPLPKGDGLASDAGRSIRNILLLAQAAMRVTRTGRVMFFCSAGVSFYEKLTWILVLLLIRRHPVMVMVDGRFPSFWQRMPPPLKVFARWVVARRSVTLATQSPLWRDHYQSLFPGADIVSVSATVSPDFFAVKGDRPPQPGLVLYVGWIIPAKGIIDLLDAFQTVSMAFGEARLRLVGPMFAKRSDWESQIADRGLSKAVDLVGPIVERALLIEELQRASVFVLPSHYEGFPVSLLESIALGVPSISTDVGGIPDILDNGRAGLIVAPREPAALAAAIEALLGDPQYRAKLSKSGATRAKSLYSSEAFIDSYLRALGLK